MPNYRLPGVYVEEVGAVPKAIAGVSTSTAAFVGLTRRGPAASVRVPKALHSFADFERVYGGLTDLKSSPGLNCVAHAAKAFFEEGGRSLFIARVMPANPTRKTTIKDWQNALNALKPLKEISIIAAPGSTEQGSTAGAIQSRLVAYAEARNAFAVLDIPQGMSTAEAAVHRGNYDSKQAAFYYPWVNVPRLSVGAEDQTASRFLALPPSGFICGIYARGDLEHGVFKAPANEVIRGAAGLERLITRGEREMLNSTGVNCLRYFAGRGCRVWGARTASSDPEWKYVNIRRYFMYLQQSLDQGTKWVVFEPNAEPLWARVRSAVSDFLLTEWRNGGLPGRKSEEAFFARCDRTTMTQNDINAGRLICLVGVAPLKPAEFVIFRIGQKTAGRVRRSNLSLKRPGI